MTVHTATTYQVTCDGTLSTACDPAHPGTPHTCTSSTTVRTGTDLLNALTNGRWTTVTRGAVDSPDARHYCPTHRDQAAALPNAASCWRGECRSCAYPETCTTSARTTPGT